MTVNHSWHLACKSDQPHLQGYLWVGRTVWPYTHSSLFVSKLIGPARWLGELGRGREVSMQSYSQSWRQEKGVGDFRSALLVAGENCWSSWRWVWQNAIEKVGMGCGKSKDSPHIVTSHADWLSNLIVCDVVSVWCREDWKPVLTVNSIVYGLQYLFLVSKSWLLWCICWLLTCFHWQEPNPEDPLNKGKWPL